MLFFWLEEGSMALNELPLDLGHKSTKDRRFIAFPGGLRYLRRDRVAQIGGGSAWNVIRCVAYRLACFIDYEQR